MGDGAYGTAFAKSLATSLATAEATAAWRETCARVRDVDTGTRDARDVARATRRARWMRGGAPSVDALVRIAFARAFERVRAACGEE